MDWRALKDVPPWEWPADTARRLLEVLRDERAVESDRLLAAALAGDICVVDDEICAQLLSIIGCTEDSNEVRSEAAIALGPVLEEADLDGFDELDRVPISESTFRNINETLKRLYTRGEIPEPVRRAILEASVRAPQDWHAAAVRAAYASADRAWKITALFCMAYISGFDAEILESLEHSDDELRYQAIVAAGVWEVDAAWPHVVRCAMARDSDKPLRLAAIEALAKIRPSEAGQVLDQLKDFGDEEIAAAITAAIDIAGSLPGDFEDDDRDDDPDRLLH